MLSERKKSALTTVCLSGTEKTQKRTLAFFSFSQIFYFVKTGNASFDLEEREKLFHFLSLQISCLAASLARQIFGGKKCVHFFRLCRFPFLLCTSLPKTKKERGNKKGEGKVCESQLQKERKRWEVCDPDTERETERKSETDLCVCVCLRERVYV